MAGGRDLNRRSPRWLNCLIYSCGLSAVAFFFWRVLTSESEPNSLSLGIASLTSRLLAAAILPALLLVTAIGRATRRLIDGI